MNFDSPGVRQAKQLLDHLRKSGFQFRRTAPGEDGPLLGQRVTGDWVDMIYIEGFSQDCVAWRQRRTTLIIPGRGLVERRITGGALTVLGEVSTWETES